MEIGSARVFIQDQRLNLPTGALEKFGCEKIFTDTASDVEGNQIDFLEVIEICRAGDSLVVWKPERLGRSLKHLFETINLLHTKKVGEPAGQTKF